MLNKKELRNRILLDLFTCKPALLLLTGGFTLAIFAWALARSIGMVIFCALVGILSSIGVILSTFFLCGKEIAQRCAEDMQRDEMKQHEHALDELQDGLNAHTPDSAHMLRDLRAMLAAFRLLASQQEVPCDLVIGIEQLFDRCVNALRQSDALWKHSENVATKHAREAILSQRNRTLDDVRQSLRQFESVLHELRFLKESELGPSELAQIREDLDRSLANAKTLYTEPACGGSSVKHDLSQAQVR